MPINVSSTSLQPLKSSPSSHQNPTEKEPRNYDRALYRARHLIENFFAKLKHYRAIATRYDKTDSSYAAS